MTLGEKISYARRVMGKKWTQEYLAEQVTKCGKQANRSWIAAIENDRFKPNVADIPFFAKALRQPLSYFSDDESSIYDDISCFPNPPESFYGKILQSRKALGLSKEQFAQELYKKGVDVNTNWISDLESGKIRSHSLDWNAICKVLKKPFEYFVSTSTDKNILKDKEGIVFGKSQGQIKISLIAVVASTSSQKFRISIDDTVAEEHISIPVNQNETRAIFAVELKGNFLNNWSKGNKYAIVAKASNAENDKIVLLRTYSSKDLKADYCIFRRIYYKPDYAELHSPDGKITKMEFEQLDIIGKILGFFTKA